MEQQNNVIQARVKSVREVLDKIKYNLDFFQREYRWERKHIEQLINDMTTKFLANYTESDERKGVANYSKYYIGSIIVSLKEGKKSIIDGQQRLTSLTLLLIYLNNLQKDNSDEDKVRVTELIFSEKYGKKSFNLEVEEREECIEALYNNQEFNNREESESISNIVGRYEDIKEVFSSYKIGEKVLPYFIDWLIDNVIFVEIETLSDEDAYIIFETMNDRGLSLTSAEMLKGYLLSKLGSQEYKKELNELWKNKILELKKFLEVEEIDKEEDLEFFKAWLRAKYADTIREKKKGSENEDFEKIGTRFHAWVRDNESKIGLKSKTDFYEFIKEKFVFYINLYLKIYNASINFQKNLEFIYYIQKGKFPKSFYYPILMAPIKLVDDEDTTNKKLALVSKFLEMYQVFRSINRRTLAYSSIRYTMFNLVKEIRDKEIQELAEILKDKVKKFDENLSGIKDLTLQQNKRFIHFLLARITWYIEEKCEISSRFEDYVNSKLEDPFEIGHIWSDNFEEHKDEFQQKDEWESYRNKIGALILLPKSFNQSYGKLSYDKKLPQYFSQNILAKTLNGLCYERRPEFLKFKKESNLPFKPHEQFKKKDILERQELYQKICEQIYDIREYDRIINQGTSQLNANFEKSYVISRL